MNEDKEQTKSGYSKRPLWQWVLIYVIVGGALYAGIYLVMGHKSGNAYGKASTAQPAQAASQVQGAAPASMTPAPMHAGQSGGW